jgi:peptide/nickel transport system substrate-binding protein
MKKLFCASFVAVVVLSISSCKKASNTNSLSQNSQNQKIDLTPVKNDWNVLWLEANPDTLNPILSTDGYASGVWGAIFDSLLRWNPETSEPEGLIAESWTVSKDGLSYDFQIRKGILFHDGKELTAEDVKFSFDRIKDPKVDAAHLQNYFAGLSKIEVIDPYKVRFTMTDVYYRNLIMLGLAQILPKHIYGVGDFNSHPANRAPIGSGPYKFNKWDTGRIVELKRFDKYFGLSIEKFKNLYNFERLLFRVITDPAVAVLALKKGDIDTMEPTPSQFVKDFNDPKFEENYYKLKYETEDGNGFNYIGWNLELPRFSSKQTRQALAYAMPREEINKKVFNGFRTLAVSPFPPSSAKTDSKIIPIPYDPVKAKALFAEAGWKPNAKGLLEKDGKPFQFEILFTTGNTDAERIALIYQQSLKQLGIEMNIRTLEWTVFLKQVQTHKFDSVMLSWGASLDSDPYQIWHSTQAKPGGSNHVSYKNPAVDKLLERARITLDREKRNLLYQEFTRTIADEAPYLFLFERPSLFIGTKRFQNVLPVRKLGLDSAAWFTPTGLEKYH